MPGKLEIQISLCMFAAVPYVLYMRLPFRTYESYDQNYFVTIPIWFNSEKFNRATTASSTNAIEAERNVYLEKLRAFERKRIRAKDERENGISHN